MNRDGKDKTKAFLCPFILIIRSILSKTITLLLLASRPSLRLGAFA